MREKKSYNRGLSISKDSPMGRRATGHDWASGSKVRAKAPRSLRREGKKWLDDCTDEEIAKAVFGINLAAEKRDFDKKKFATKKGLITKLEKQIDPNPATDEILQHNREVQDSIKSIKADMEEMEAPIKRIEDIVAEFRSARS
jgi:hypothetical protein